MEGRGCKRLLGEQYRLAGKHGARESVVLNLYIHRDARSVPLHSRYNAKDIQKRFGPPVLAKYQNSWHALRRIQHPPRVPTSTTSNRIKFRRHDQDKLLYVTLQPWDVHPH